MSREPQKPQWYSSYEENNYGELFYALMRIYRPEVVVELGTEAGYSAYHIARGLRHNQKGRLECYDLWEKYQAKDLGSRDITKSTAEQNLKDYWDLVSLKQRDTVGVHQDYESVDILHVDLHNEGKILEKVIPNWVEKVRQLIILEGGSAQRDQVDWMLEYNERPIAKWLEEFTSKRGDIECLTIEPFPSLTLIRKK